MLRTKLSVNLNKVALLRNSREGNWPDPVFFGRIALEAGAAGLTVHPRPDERHVRATDVPAIAALVSEYPDREYNIEGNPFHNLMGHLEAVRPRSGDVRARQPRPENVRPRVRSFDPAVCDAVRPLIAQAKAWGCRVSLFMDPAPALMAKAAELGADRVELYTEGWAQAHGTEAQDKVLEQYAASVKAAREAGLDVNAGHDLSLDNLEVFLKACREVSEVSIGHALTAEALQFGFAETVRRYEEILDRVAASED